MHTVVMPKMSDIMEEGKILSWHKQEGDTVEKGESLAEVETEKVNVEVESFFEGVLRKILAPVGQAVPVGQPIALVGTAEEPLPADLPGAQPGATTNASAPQATPEPGSHAEAAPAQSAPQPVAQPLTAQGHTRPEQPVPMAGANTPGVNGYAPNGSHANGTATSATLAETGGRYFASPIARRIAQEHALDLHSIQGTGPSGRIIREDVEQALRAPRQPRAQPAPQPVLQTLAQAPTMTPTPSTPSPAQAPTAPGEEVRAVPLSAMRRTIAKRLQQSMQTAPHFYVTMAIDMTRAGELRKQINDYAQGETEPVKVSYNDMIVKAVALALARIPEINVSFDGENLLYKQRVHIGVAVALDQGLIVPVVRDANTLGIVQIARETQRLADAARTGKLKPEEFAGGTFSISNLGMFGVEEFTAIINPPESAILAVGAIEPTPVVVDGQIAVRNRMKVTLSVDHRAIDGAQAARFLQEVKRLLEQPMGMLV